MFYFFNFPPEATEPHWLLCVPHVPPEVNNTAFSQFYDLFG